MMIMTALARTRGASRNALMGCLEVMFIKVIGLMLIIIVMMIKIIKIIIPKMITIALASERGE